MTAQSARLRARKGHIAEKATIDHLVHSFSGEPPKPGRVVAAFTDSGLRIEDQLRKTWNRTVTGLAIF